MKNSVRAFVSVLLASGLSLLSVKALANSAVDLDGEDVFTASCIGEWANSQTCEDEGIAEQDFCDLEDPDVVHEQVVVVNDQVVLPNICAANPTIQLRGHSCSFKCVEKYGPTATGSCKTMTTDGPDCFGLNLIAGYCLCQVPLPPIEDGN